MVSHHPPLPDSNPADLGSTLCVYSCTYSGHFTEMESEVLTMSKVIVHVKSCDLSQCLQVCTGFRVH